MTIFEMISWNWMYNIMHPRPIMLIPSAAEILTDTEEIMKEIGMSEAERDGLKLWAELESYAPEYESEDVRRIDLPE